MSDTVDPATGLSENQKDAVRDNWAKVAANWKTNGPEFFMRLFQTFPRIKTFFKGFEGMSDDEIRKSSKLRAHTINFKHGIASLVDNLDDVEVLLQLIHKLSNNHFRRQVRVEHFKDAFDLYKKFLQDVSDIDEFGLSSWSSTLDVVTKVIGDRMQELTKETDGQ